MAKTISDLNAEIDATLPNNNSKSITPAKIRTVAHDIVNNMQVSAGQINTDAGTPSSSTFLRGDNTWNHPSVAATDIATSSGTPSSTTILYGDNTWKTAPTGGGGGTGTASPAGVDGDVQIKAGTTLGALARTGGVSTDYLARDNTYRSLPTGTFSGTGDPGLTRALHITTNYASPPNVIRTSGYSTAGDWGGGTYIKVGSQPDHAGWFQTLDGAYYELVPTDGAIWVEQFGTLKLADYDATSPDAAPGIKAAVDYAVFNRFGVCDVRCGPGTYYLGSTIILKGRAFTFEGMNTGMTSFATSGTPGIQGTYFRPAKNTDGILCQYTNSFEKDGVGYFANASYTVGRTIWFGETSDDRSYICTQAGTTGASSPPTGTGTGIVDGTVKWDFYRHTSRVERTSGAFSGRVRGIYLDSHWYRWGGNTTDPWGGRDVHSGACGIFSRTRVYVEECFSTNFSGCGIAIVANGDPTYYNSSGNSNHWRVNNCGSYFNGLDGLHIGGSDANGGYSNGCDYSTNGRWAVAEFSFLGNQHTASESAYDGEATASFSAGNDAPYHYVTYGGSYWVARIPLLGITNSYDYSIAPGTGDGWLYWSPAFSGPTTNYPTWVNTGYYEAGGAYGTINANCRSTWTGGYVEGSDSKSQFGRFDNVFGNLLSSVVPDRCQTILQDGAWRGMQMTENQGLGPTGFGGAHTVWLGGRGTAGSDYRARNLLQFQTDAFDFYNMMITATDGTDPVGNLGFTRNGSGFPYAFMTLDYTSAKFGKASSVGFGAWGFGKLMIGDGDPTNGRQVTMFNGALPPTDGRDVARGEVFFRRDATPGAVGMVVCTTAGLAGSTAVFKTLATVAA